MDRLIPKKSKIFSTLYMMVVADLYDQESRNWQEQDYPAGIPAGPESGIRLKGWNVDPVSVDIESMN